MKSKIFFTLFLIQISLSGSIIHWYTDFDAAASQSKSTNKPIAMFFIGSDWCPWCKKMDREILKHKDFINLAFDKMVFMRVDFPRYKKLPGELAVQNKALSQRFKVRSYPTVVILSPEQSEIARTGYRRGGGKEYANYLLSIIG